MVQKDREFRQLVYDLMNGSLDLEKAPVKERDYIKNEFAEGEYCSEKYREVYEANMRLCRRLGNLAEDSDVEIIITCLLEIQEYMCMKIFDYGWMYARGEGASQ